MRNASSSRCSPQRRTLAPSKDRQSFKLLLIVSCFLSGHAEPQQGVYDLLRKLQESLLGSHAPRREVMRPLSSKSSSRPGKLQRTPEKARRVTQRRALLEYTLNTYYGSFLGGGRSFTDEQLKESWTDKSTQCILYNEANNSYWTYYWCPESHVKQVHLKPKSLNEDGSVKEFVASRVIRLGRFQSGTKVKASSQDAFAKHEQKIIGIYEGGDDCEILDNANLRGKKKRTTSVVHEKFCDPADDEEFQILSVEESQPCRYTIRVCSKQPHSNLRMNDKVDKDTSPSEQDVDDARSAYSQQSGLDAARMSTGDRTSSLHVGLPPFPPSRKLQNVELIRDMFIHAYDSYMYNAYPASELKPISCTPGTFDLVRLPALTLIDTLDTLIIMGNFTEFARATERLRDFDESMKYGVDNEGHSIKIEGGGMFAQNQNVSVFETTIRVLGGLLSAHQLAMAYMDKAVLDRDVRDDQGNILFGGPVNSSLPVCLADPVEVDDSTENTDDAAVTDCSHDCGNQTSTLLSESFWTYDGLFLELAHDMGRRLLPAFNTRTGIPYGTVNLMTGIPRGETPIASLAGGGTLNLEFELLSRLTGDDSFGKAAKLATRALWMRRSSLHLLGKHVDVEKGEWTETLSGIGSNSDSFYEYMIKHYILFPEDSDFWTMFVATYNGVFNDTRLGEWYADVDMNSGFRGNGSSRRTFESLMAFYPGMQVLAGELSPAAKTLNSFFMVRETTGLLPERFNYAQWKVESGGAGLHPLRPELLESCYFLHKATEGISAKRTSPSADDETDRDESGWLWAADYSLHTINRLAWTPCGFSIIKEVNPATTGAIPGPNQQTTPKVKTGNEMPSFFLSETLKYLYLAFDDNSILHKDEDREWVFTTEAHPIHHEPKKEYDFGIGDTEVDVPREELKMLLRARVMAHTDKLGNKSPVVHQSKSLYKRSEEEKWAIKTLSSHYMNDILETEAAFPVRGGTVYARSMVFNFQSHLHTTGLIGSYVTTANAIKDDAHSKTHREKNVAGLSWNGQGLETSLSKGCPNIHSSSLLWMHALNGGGLDYGDVYVSSLSDETPVDKRFAVGSLSAAAALAFHGSGLFLGMAEHDDTTSCSIVDDTVPPLVQTLSKETKNTPDGTQRFDMGGEVGSFDVSVFADGNGFYVHHVNSGETVVTTIIASEAQGGEIAPPYVMVYSSTPRQQSIPVTVQTDEDTTVSWKFSSGSWKAIFNRKGGDINNDEKVKKIALRPVRKVVVAANNEESFSCEVQLVRRYVMSKTAFVDVQENDETAIEYEKIMSFYPCAPGLFGPTMVSELVGNNGVIAEGPLHLPPVEDPLGCIPAENPVSHYPEDQPVQLVNRGKCTFQSKAMNQVKGQQARAVIVVNGLNDELFLMSNGTGSDPTAEHDEDDRLPASVLVTGTDGGELVADMLKYGSMIAKVMVRPQRGGLRNDSNGNIIIYQNTAGFLDWPAVKTTPDAIQVFMSQGWGVHAVDRTKEKAEEAAKASAAASKTSEERTLPSPKHTIEPAAREWQLYLLQHHLTSTSVN